MHNLLEGPVVVGRQPVHSVDVHVIDTDRDVAGWIGFEEKDDEFAGGHDNLSSPKLNGLAR